MKSFLLQLFILINIFIDSDKINEFSLALSLALKICSNFFSLLNLFISIE